jgi:hypothetical protein
MTLRIQSFAQYSHAGYRLAGTIIEPKMGLASTNVFQLAIVGDIS